MMTSLACSILPVGGIGDGEDVRRDLVALLAFVDLDDLLRVDGKADVRVHDHAEEARVGLEPMFETIVKLYLR